MGKVVTDLEAKVERIEAVWKDVAFSYKFDDQKVFSLNDVSLEIVFITVYLIC